MTTMSSLRDQSIALRDEVKALSANKSLTVAEKSARFDVLDAKRVELENAIENRKRANAILSATDLGDPGVQARSFMPGVTGKSVRPASATDLGDDIWAEAFEAATRRKGFRAQIGAKAPTTIGLPAVVQPNLT